MCACPSFAQQKLDHSSSFLGLGMTWGVPQRLEAAEWGFAQERSIMHELLHGCVLLTIASSVWMSGIFLKNAQSLVHGSAPEGGTSDKCHLVSLTYLQLIFFSIHMELTKDNKIHAWPVYCKNWLFICWC